MKKFVTLLTLCFLVTGSIEAQQLDKNQVHDLVQSKNFVFKAEYVLPMGAPSRFLTSDYDLKIHGDSLISYLPYFGRSYVAPPPGEGGINFTSTDYEYKTKAKKKGRWEITLKPREADIKNDLILEIYENGTARLMISSSERQSISYTGYIKK